MRRIASALLLAAAFAAAPAAAQDSTVVVVVRHAEKAPPATDRDPALSEAGQARARALAEVVRGMGIDAALVTQLRRTRLTAEPAAAEAGIAPRVVPVGGAPVEAHAREVARVAAEAHAGRTVLVVGHSNTVPLILHALGAPPMPELCEGEYAHLFVVVLRPGAPAELRRTTFGAPDAEDAAACHAAG